MELLWATKKVKNKDTDMVDDDDHVIQEFETNKISFKEILMGNRSIGTEEDVHLSLKDEEEITLLENDVKNFLRWPIPSGLLL